jgi:hypothetical protein
VLLGFFVFAVLVVVVEDVVVVDVLMSTVA